MTFPNITVFICDEKIPFSKSICLLNFCNIYKHMLLFSQQISNKENQFEPLALFSCYT